MSRPKLVRLCLNKHFLLKYYIIDIFIYSFVKSYTQRIKLSTPDILKHNKLH